MVGKKPWIEVSRTLRKGRWSETGRKVPGTKQMGNREENPCEAKRGERVRSELLTLSNNKGAEI